MHDQARFVRPANGASSGVRWLTRGQVLDVLTGTAELRNLRVDEGVITEVTGHSPPPGADVTDLGGRFVVPGLISCHTHLQGLYPYELRREDEPPGVTAIRAAARARRILAMGVTTVRSLHEQSRADISVRIAAASGWTEAPRILAAGRGLTCPGGHGNGLGCAIASGADAFRSAARAELQAGADHVKVYLSGGLARDGEDLEVQLDAEELQAVVLAAREASTYVVAHTAGDRSIELGLSCGVRSFEHGYRISRATAAHLSDAHAFLTPTLTVTHTPLWQTAAGFTDAHRARADAVREEHEHSARLAIGENVQIVAGTDFPPEEYEGDLPLMIHELALLTRVGMSSLEALRAATSTPAELLNLSDQIGRIGEGLRADLLVVDEDPTHDITALARPRLVLRDGRVVQHDL